ncbi:hypothetical protein EVAR_78458_1 [Eumeta japonica]|uniref:Uncharacterized protein n=1 Tax=Eumeta variegata TaxID=151549 RepID=A0A4C1TYB4_EUMVA|nr:hypothetical protein EVAR_78458_1 [Eumeta japonica]
MSEMRNAATEVYASGGVSVLLFIKRPAINYDKLSPLCRRLRMGSVGRREGLKPQAPPSERAHVPQRWGD